MPARFRHAAFLLASCIAASMPAQDVPANLVTINASAPIPPPETGYLHMGTASAGAHSLQVNSRYLVLDGKPWLPVMGELHYSRLPESQWEDEILKMKAGGINIVSTYVFWIHQEEIEGHFDWTGRRDLRHFVELCAKHGMYVWLRPGPWAHGEVRNGGFPDWLVDQANTRTNDPAYLAHVKTLFDQIGQQVHGLMFQQGGPVLGAQLENEYGQHGPGRGAEHILALKRIAIAAGIDPPLFSVTGWPSLDFPPREVLPVSGGYPDGFWYGSQTNLPPSMNYLFNFNRELGDMGATVPSEDPTGKVNLQHDPYFEAEQAGGMAAAYHRRPVLTADDIAALILTGIGSGVNLYGYYMYHGGTNPQGLRSTLQESVATGYPNDLPELTYDFNAPIGEFGQERESYRRTRLMHLFLNSYGSTLAPMPAFAPTPHTRDAADSTHARVAVRTDGASGYVFVDNYVRQLDMPARPAFQVALKLPSGTQQIPLKPIDLPANTYFCWPFHLPLGAASLRYSTAQLLTRIQTPTGELVVFYTVPGIPSEFVFNRTNLKSIRSPNATITRTGDAVQITGLVAGMNSTVEVVDDRKHRVTLLLLTREQAEQTAVLHMGRQDHLLMTPSSVLYDGSVLRLRSTESATQRFAVLPALSVSQGAPTTLGQWTSYTFPRPARSLKADVEQLQQATARVAMKMGPYVDWRKTAVPLAPPEAMFRQAAIWSLTTPEPADLQGINQVLLRVRYTGDEARLTRNNRVVDDNFFNGLPWEVGFAPGDLRPHAFTLQLSILPMPNEAPIYLDAAARTLLNNSRENPSLLSLEIFPEYELSVLTKPKRSRFLWRKRSPLKPR